MCLFKRLKEKPCSWCNFYRYNRIEVGKPVVYSKADGTQYMDGKVIAIRSIELQGKETVIELETGSNVLLGVIDRGEGFIPYPNDSYGEEGVM